MVSLSRFCWVFLFLVALPTGLQAQSRSRVHYHDNLGKQQVTEGDLRETLDKVDVLGPTKNVLVSVPIENIIRIDYGEMPGVDRSQQLAATTLENRNEPEKTHAEFAKMLKATPPNAPVPARRYLGFREAMLASQITLKKTGDEFTTEAQALLTRLILLAQNHSDHWVTWHLFQEAGILLGEMGNYVDAGTRLAELGRNKNLATRLALRAKLDAASYFFRADRRDQALALINDVLSEKSLPRSSEVRKQAEVMKMIATAPPPPVDPLPQPQKPKVVPQIEQALGGLKDLHAKAVCYSALSDYLISHRCYRDAMWACLWIDVVYSQSFAERLKARARLVVILEMLGDKDRSNSYKTKHLELRASR